MKSEEKTEYFLTQGEIPPPTIAIKYVELKFGNQWNGIKRYYLFKKEEGGKISLPYSIQ